MPSAEFASAMGKMSALAARAETKRESLYRMLSENGNPEFIRLNAVLHAMGLKLAVSVI